MFPNFSLNLLCRSNITVSSFLISLLILQINVLIILKKLKSVIKIVAWNYTKELMFYTFLNEPLFTIPKTVALYLPKKTPLEDVALYINSKFIALICHQR